MIIECLPSDWRDAHLLGRLLTREGPTPVLVRGGRVRAGMLVIAASLALASVLGYTVGRKTKRFHV
jgi:fumarylacetoacetate (FAA) hydrolase family protein